MAEPLSTRAKLTWVAILYFAEGFPFGLLFDAFPVYFRTHGVSLADIGLISLAGLPWTLKFLWAPAVDLWGKRRSWVVICQGLLAVDIALFLLLEPTQSSGILWTLLIALAVFSATQDIAIDAYTIELLEESEMGPANGVRVSMYRVALICAGGVFVALAGLIGWRAAFATAAILLAGSALLSSRAPETSVTQPLKESWTVTLEHAVIGPLQGFWQRPGVVYVMLFVLTFKLGDMALGPMVRPFWVDRHFTPLQIGAIPGTVGVVSTIAGALLGGRLTKTWGLFRALWVLGIAQAASNLAYAAAAALPPSPSLMYSASVIESFCGGLGTAPFLAFLMSVCEKTQAATQYALLSALFGLTRSLSGAFSGLVTQSVGYATYFTATFFLAWPAFALLPWVKGWINDNRESESKECHSERTVAE
ncbi:MAG TPA: MFS transporter [Candidatus Binatia bacterium]|nr:MFS transporter [Candidatus Binatia bacterium]